MKQATAPQFFDYDGLERILGQIKDADATRRPTLEVVKSSTDSEKPARKAK
jgi:hypothetical protein